MRHFLAGILLLPSVGLASEGAIESLTVATSVITPTPNGALHKNQLLSQDSRGQLSITATGVSEATAIGALSRELNDFVISSNVSFSAEGQEYLSDTLLRVASGQPLIVDDVQSLNPFTRSTGINAVSTENGSLYAVPSTATKHSSGLISPQDILHVTDTGSQIFLDGSEVGIPASASISALQVLPDGNFLVSFSSGFRVGMLAVRPADIIHINRNSGFEFTKFLGRSKVVGNCESCRVTGMAATIDIDVIFRDSFFSTWE